MNSKKLPKPVPEMTKEENQKPDTWRSTTMLSPSEIESLKEDSKRSKILIREELVRLDEEKAKRSQ
jgi:hypothetical protein